MALRNRVVKNRAQRIRVKDPAQRNVTAVLVLNAFFKKNVKTMEERGQRMTWAATKTKE